jgi:hypothetical protein
MEGNMKRHITGIILMLFLGTFSWGQATKESFDTKKSREELEIMRGILKTTLTFVAQNSPDKSSRWRFSNLNAFYLAGQGAVFVIPTSGYRILDTTGYSFYLNPEFSQDMASLSKEISAYSREVAAEAGRVAGEALASSYGRWGSGVTVVAPPVPPVPPAPPAPQSSVQGRPEKPEKPAKPTGAGSGVGSGQGAGVGSGTGPGVGPGSGAGVNREELRRTVEEFQAKARKSREEAEANRQKFLQTLSEVKQYLIETLANYGDSLTTVKPDEYVNLVLLTDDFDSQKTGSDILSARKAWITDYKAGKLTLDAFKQKVLQYNQ